MSCFEIFVKKLNTVVGIISDANEKFLYLFPCTTYLNTLDSLCVVRDEYLYRDEHNELLTQFDA